MKTDKHGTVVLSAGDSNRNPLRHRAPDRLHSLRSAVSSQNPDQTFLSKSLSKKLAIGLRRFRRENRLVFILSLRNPPAPRWQQRDVHATPVGLIDDERNVIPIVVLLRVAMACPGRHPG